MDFEAALQGFAQHQPQGCIDGINAKPVLKEHEATLKKIVEDFVATGTY